MPTPRKRVAACGKPPASESVELPAQVTITGLRPLGSRPIDERALVYGSVATRKAEFRAREFVRAGLAILSLGLVAATVVLAWISSSNTVHWKNAQQWLQVVLPAETAIVGSALGFYFGDRRHAKDDADD